MKWEGAREQGVGGGSAGEGRGGIHAKRDPETACERKRPPLPSSLLQAFRSTELPALLPSAVSGPAGAESEGGWRCVHRLGHPAPGEMDPLCRLLQRRGNPTVVQPHRGPLSSASMPPHPLQTCTPLIPVMPSSHILSHTHLPPSPPAEFLSCLLALFLAPPSPPPRSHRLLFPVSKHEATPIPPTFHIPPPSLTHPPHPPPLSLPL